MEKQTQTADIPKWSALLVEAVNKPGLIMDAYSVLELQRRKSNPRAHSCQLRGIQPPINTFGRRQAESSNAKALTLCMPLTRKRRR